MMSYSMQVKTAQRYSSRTPTRVYEIYPQFGGFSVKRVDYHGITMSVAATSVSQAYAVAHKNVWIDPEHKYPVGIVSVYNSHTDTTTLWCGCSGHSVTGGHPGHGAGVRALRAEIDAHHCIRTPCIHRTSSSTGRLGCPG